MRAGRSSSCATLRARCRLLPESVHLLRPKGFLGDTVPPVWIEDLEGLLGLVDIGAIELHPWNCTVDDLDHPDVLVFDLEGLEWRAVTKAALALRNMLAADGLKSWPKLTGTNGIQVMVSLESRVTYDLAQRYSAAIARRVIAKDPASDGRLFIHTEGNYRSRSTIGTVFAARTPRLPHRCARHLETNRARHSCRRIRHHTSVPRIVGLSVRKRPLPANMRDEGRRTPGALIYAWSLPTPSMATPPSLPALSR